MLDSVRLLEVPKLMKINYRPVLTTVISSLISKGGESPKTAASLKNDFGNEGSKLDSFV